MHSTLIDKAEGSISVIVSSGKCFYSRKRQTKTRSRRKRKMINSCLLQFYTDCFSISSKRLFISFNVLAVEFDSITNYCGSKKCLFSMIFDE